MPVRSDGHVQRRGAAQRPGRLTKTRAIGLLLLLVGVVATAVSLISVALR